MDTPPRTDARPNVSAGPLAGVRVLEAGSLIAGPFCGQLLGDFGAEVIKIEDPGAGDPMRQWGAQKVDGLSLSWPIIARNKKSVTCNLRTAAGQQIVRDLVRESDVLIENFRPGTFERWGLGYQALRELNPRLVFVRVTGYGQDGPYSRRAGFGSVGEAMGGIRNLTGEPNRMPARIGVSLGDSLAGTFAALGATIALLNRVRSGEGQIVDSAIYEAVLALMESTIPEWALAGVQRQRTGAVLPGVAPSNVYPTGDGKDILIAANRDTVFNRLCDLMAQPELKTDPRFGTHQARGLNMAELDGLIAKWTTSGTSDEVLETLHRGGVPAGRIYTAEDMVGDPHYAARNAIVTLTHDVLGEFPMQNVVPQLSATPGRVRSLGPTLGQHNAEVYGQLLQMDSTRLTQLTTEGVI
ncbi:MAG: CoA transferase [Mycobacterium sp.]